MSHFDDIESDSKLIRIFFASINHVRIVRQADFRPIREDAFPQVSNLIDALSGQQCIGIANENESKANEYI